MSLKTSGPAKLSYGIEKFPIRAPFRISGHEFTEFVVVTLSVERNGSVGRGEAAGVYYLNDDADNVIAMLQAVESQVAEGLSREALQTVMPPSGARNALDCAYWDLEAKETGIPVWQLAGTPEPKSLMTTLTLGADDPGKMATGAAEYGEARALKLKLTGELELDLHRVSAVKAARPECWIGVDANQGYVRENLPDLISGLEALDVKLLEQPLQRGREADLDGIECAIPIAADESVLSAADLAGLVGRFQVINIKLDKCGGLTEALKMVQTARSLGLQVMVGSMMSTSLAMAPAYLIGQYCDVVDLDGPTLLSYDRSPYACEYSAGMVSCPPELWGAVAAA